MPFVFINESCSEFASDPVSLTSIALAIVFFPFLVGDEVVLAFAGGIIVLILRAVLPEEKKLDALPLPPFLPFFFFLANLRASSSRMSRALRPL